MVKARIYIVNLLDFIIINFTFNRRTI